MDDWHFRKLVRRLKREKWFKEHPEAKRFKGFKRPVHKPVNNRLNIKLHIGLRQLEKEYQEMVRLPNT